MSPATSPFNTLDKLSLADVRYLSFEGGGGKGFAYIGALQALEERGLLPTANGDGHPYPRTPDYLTGIDPSRRPTPDSVRGVSGSSAGAITALLVSCGYNADDIRQIMTCFDFSRLFEPPTPRYVPNIQVNPDSDDPFGAVEKPVNLPPYVQGINGSLKGAVANIPPPVQDFLSHNLGSLLPQADSLLAAVGLSSVRTNRQTVESSEWRRLLDAAISRFAGQKKQEVQTAVSGAASTMLMPLQRMLPSVPPGRARLPKIVERLSQFAPGYAAFLPEDLGLFAGYEARRLFAELLAYKLPLRNGKPWYNVTFLDHYRHFRVTLAVTGTNFETKKAGVFSWKTTPNFPVADAIRLSMSLPFVYKPVVIRPEHYPEGYLPDWVNGVWVDGGYLDNIPLHIFDHEGGPNPKTLGLRLSQADEQPTRIGSIADFMTTWANFGVWGAGEAHISEPNRNLSQTIVLDTTGLHTLDFEPDVSVRDRVIERARLDTLRYFAD